MKLFVSEGNPHCLKAVAALEVTGVKCDVQYVSHEGKTAWLSLWYSSLLVTCDTLLTTELQQMANPTYFQVCLKRVRLATFACGTARANASCSQACGGFLSLMNGVGWTPEAARKLQCTLLLLCAGLGRMFLLYMHPLSVLCSVRSLKRRKINPTKAYNSVV